MESQPINIELDEALKQSNILENASRKLQAGIQGFYGKLGRSGKFIQNILNGTWLGHPLHPVLVDIPIGAWTVMVMLDLFESATGRKKYGNAADVAGTIGTITAAGAAAAGLTDWQHTRGQARRIGFVHAALNTATLGLMIASLSARRNKLRTLGRGTGLLGYLLVVVSAYLGGDLVYRQKVGVKRGEVQDKSETFWPTIHESELFNNQLKRVDVEGAPVLIARVNGQIYSMADTCSHMGCSLAQGRLGEDQSVICNCHGSRFELASGRVMDGPSAYSQVHYDVRVTDNGMVEVRRRR